MPSTQPSTLDEFRSAIKNADSEILRSIKKFGELLVLAGKVLSSDDYKTLWAELRAAGRTEADLKAAVAVGNGTLDERLFPVGVTHSKVMNMSRYDQERLLSDEKFRVYSDRSPNKKDADYRSWSEMTRDQRNRLISDKGGRIQSLDEQRAPGKVRKNIAMFVGVSYHKGDSHISLFNGDKEGRIDLSDIRHSLSEPELDALIEELQ